MVHNLISRSRISEVIAVSKRMIGAFEKTSLNTDEHLNDMFDHLREVHERLVTASTPDKVLSTLREKDELRDEKVRNLYYYLIGQTHTPNATARSAAKEVLSTFEKYGLDIIKENYAAESGQLVSMLMDFDQAFLRKQIELIPECSKLIERLRSAQNDFEAVRIAYEESKAVREVREKAATIKREVLAAINGQIVNYLLAMENSKKSRFGAFARIVDQIIKDNNDTVKKRSKKDSDEE